MVSPVRAPIYCKHKGVPVSTLCYQVISVLTMHEHLGSVAKPHKTGSGLGWDNGSLHKDLTLDPQILLLEDSGPLV